MAKNRIKLLMVASLVTVAGVAVTESQDKRPQVSLAGRAGETLALPDGPRLSGFFGIGGPVGSVDHLGLAQPGEQITVSVFAVTTTGAPCGVMVTLLQVRANNSPGFKRKFWRFSSGQGTRVVPATFFGEAILVVQSMSPNDICFFYKDIDIL